jgi:hypothetical protein
VITGPFTPVGKSFTITVAAANQVTPVNLADLGLTQIPASIRCVNNGPQDVWIVASSANNPVAAFPVAGTVTTGTPQAGWRLKSGVVEVFQFSAAVALVPNAAGNGQSPGFYIALIGAAAGPSTIDFTLGEGL